MRRAPFAFVVIACFAGQACGDVDLPDRLWRSDHVRYFTRDSDNVVCPAILDEIEAHGAVIADRLGIEQTIVSYYKFDGWDDFKAHAGCPASTGGCSLNATTRTPLGFHRHELIHAYLAPYGHPPPLLSEGAAVALACERRPRPIGSWRDAYAAKPPSLEVYAAGGWLVGHLLRMFRALWLVELYSSVPVNATADQFAKAFERIYGMSLDVVWAAAIGGTHAPMDCPWECGRPSFEPDGQPVTLSPVCGADMMHLSVDLPGGVTRWQVDGAGRISVHSCDGNEEPASVVSGWFGRGGMMATLAAGKWFVEANVDPGATATFAASTGVLDGLSWSDCAAAPAVPDDLRPFGNFSLFYPSSMTPRFTTFAAGTDQPGGMQLLSEDASLTASLCTSCDPQTCAAIMAGITNVLETPAIVPGAVLNISAGSAATAYFFWP
jgi:hypothetical protein